MDTRQTRPEMLSTTKFTLDPEDCLEGILPNFHYLVTYSGQDMTTKTVGRCIVDEMTRHCYLSTTILTDKSPKFRSKMWTQIAQTLELRISVRQEDVTQLGCQ